MIGLIVGKDVVKKRRSVVSRRIEDVRTWEYLIRYVGRESGTCRYGQQAAPRSFAGSRFGNSITDIPNNLFLASSRDYASISSSEEG